MPSKRETFATDPHELKQYEDTNPPHSMFEAMMVSTVCTPMQETYQEAAERYEPLHDALETGVLTERELWVIEGLFWRRLSLRAVARELSLSKTFVAKLRDQAILKLQNQLSDEDTEQQ